MLKKFPWRQRTKHRTPTTKNGKFVITFKVLGTPVKYPDERIIPISQNSSNMNITHTQIHIEAGGKFGYRESCACQQRDGAWESGGSWGWPT
jgi:hypothetical protein